MTILKRWGYRYDRGTQQYIFQHFLGMQTNILVTTKHVDYDSDSYRMHYRLIVYTYTRRMFHVTVLGQHF